MIDDREVTDFIEAERYELFAAPGHNFHFDRRDFIKTFGLGILFVVPLTRAFSQQQEESGQGGSNNNLPNNIGAWIHIDEDGGVTVFTGKVEFGQNIRTSLTQAVAEELEEAESGLATAQHAEVEARAAAQRIAAALPNDEIRRVFEVAEPVRLLGRLE